MPLEERDLKYLWDMLNEARDAQSFVAGVSRESYLASALVRHAVERAIEIVGEAARRVSSDGRAQLPGVAWGAIVATRHILAHEYGDIDHDKIWAMVTVHIPELIRQLEPVIAAHPPGPEATIDPGEP